MEKIQDYRHLFVVNGYSLGAIIYLLERLNLLIDSENGEKNSLSNRSILYDEPSAFNEKENDFHYRLEDSAIEIFEDFEKFCKKTVNSFDNWCNSQDMVFISDDGENKKIVKGYFQDFYKMQNDEFAGFTPMEWGKIFDDPVFCVLERIKTFIPEFKFELQSLVGEKKEWHLNRKNDYPII